MISPCGGCDPYFAAAVVCYLSFFFSGCSFFLYWYWLSSYHEEQSSPSPSRCYNQDHDSDCESLDVENPTVPHSEPFQEYVVEISPNFVSDFNTSEKNPTFPQEESSSSSANPYSTNIDIVIDETYARLEPSEPHHSLSLNPSHNPISCCLLNPTQINLLPSSSTKDNSVSTVNVISSADLCDSYDDYEDEGGLRGCDRGENETEESEEKTQISDNPYLNGENYSQNVLWGLHGIFTNLFEAILAAVFYNGLFENNLTTSLVWFIGFWTNFVIGNLLYLILLCYCTNRNKMKQLRVRWALESIFNIGKDLYYLWVGTALLDHLIKIQPQ